MTRFFLALLGCVGIVSVVVAADTQPEVSRKSETSAVGKPKPQLHRARVQGHSFVRRFGGSATAQIREDVDPQDNVERFLLLTPRGPIVVEAAITFDGQPFRVAREKLVDEMLEAADTDGDGKRTWKEAFDNHLRFIIGDYASRIMLSRESNPEGARAQRDIFTKRYDANKDGLVDRPEARWFFAQSSGGPAFFATDYPHCYGGSDVKKMLDSNGDGTLSEDELKAAEQRLKSRDANNNDALEPPELPSKATIVDRGGRQVVMGYPYNRRWLLPSSWIQLLGPAADPVGMYWALQNKYGDENREIPSESFPLLTKLITQLDANGNGLLDFDEADSFDRLPPHITLELNFGKGELPSLLVKSVAPQLGPKKAARVKSAAEAHLELPGVAIRFSAVTWSGIADSVFNHEYRKLGTAGRIKYLDKNRNGFLERKEYTDNNQGLLRDFVRMDANGDGKVSIEEIVADFDRQRAPATSRAVTSVLQRGSSLFHILDVSGDSQLSLQEMRSAAQRLLDFDTNNDGQLDSEELPVRIDVTFTRGGRYTGHAVMISGPGIPWRQPVPIRGPDWFIRMDRDGDGGVTWREFIGSPEQFKKIDTDNNRFIQPKEAEAFELPATKK